MPEKKFEILNRETLFQGHFRLDRYTLKHEKHEGGWTRPIKREVFCQLRPTVGLLPFDPQEDKVVLIEQFRPGVLGHDENPWMIQIVAGVGEVGETLEESARRESLEEAGCRITEFQPICDCFPSPGNYNEHISLFVGRASIPQNNSIHGVASEDEDIRVLVMPSTEAINLLYAKKIKCAATLITLQWFALHRTELRSRWSTTGVSTPLI